MAGAVDAACMMESNYHLFGAEGILQPGSTRVLSRTPYYDHCNMTAGPGAFPGLIERFRELLLGMSYDDPDVRLLFDLEGLKGWKEGREEGYEQLESAVDALGFYDRQGNITCLD
jgi:phosphonate transport system substrate-binding protein